MGQSNQVVTDVLEFGERWAAAELRGDTAALGGLLADDFVGIGPRGFRLDKKAWLNRYSSGALKHKAFAWRDVEVRVYGDTAVAVGTEDAQGSYGGHDVSGRCSSTHILVRASGSWVIAGMHLSPAPPVPPGPPA